MVLVFTEIAWGDYQYLLAHDRQSHKKANERIKDICRNPYSGLGKPEPLKGAFSGFWSRRINQEDRIVYRIDGGRVEIVQCRTHYRDK